MTTSELEIWKALNELPKVKAVFGEGYQRYDLFWCEELEGERYYCDCEYCNKSCEFDRTWVIPLYDSIRPERSLWGIFKKMVLEINAGWEVKDWADSHIGRVAGSSDRPDLALARAILEQKEKG